jgi:hypothetical protein
MKTLDSLLLLGGLASGTALAAEPKLDLNEGHAFETTVTGFLTTENPTAGEAAELDSSWQPAAFLTITGYSDQRFHDSVMAVIAEGNTLNAVDSSGRVQFRLGCFEAKSISNDEFTVPDQSALLASAPARPVTVTLQFKKSAAQGDSYCVSFADGLTVQAATDTAVSQ